MITTLVLGDSGVGKTSLVTYAYQHTFSKDTLATIGLKIAILKSKIDLQQRQVTSCLTLREFKDHVKRLLAQQISQSSPSTALSEILAEQKKQLKQDEQYLDRTELTDKQDILSLLIQRGFSTGSQIYNDLRELTILPENKASANFDIKVILHDISGAKQHSSFRSIYYSQAQSAILVCDVTNQASFDHLSTYLKELPTNFNKQAITLIANKTDLVEQRMVSDEQLADFAAMYNLMPFIQTSAASGQSVKQAFDTMILKAIDNDPGLKKYLISQIEGYLQQAIIILSEYIHQRNSYWSRATYCFEFRQGRRRQHKVGAATAIKSTLQTALKEINSSDPPCLSLHEAITTIGELTPCFQQAITQGKLYQLYETKIRALLPQLPQIPLLLPTE